MGALDILMQGIAASKAADTAASGIPDPSNPNVLWSPDYSSFIDISKTPGATWGETGWQVNGQPVQDAFGNGGDTSSDEGRMSASSFGGTPIDVLKQYGLWNIKDQNSPTWNYLSARAGKDVRNDPEAFYIALSGLYGGSSVRGDGYGYERVYDDLVSQGFDPQYAGGMRDAMKAYVDYAKTDPSSVHNIGDFFKQTLSFAGDVLSLPPIQAALGVAGLQGLGVLPGADAAASAGGTAAGAGGLSSVSGPELAQLIESGTMGLEGAALEAAGLSGGSALFNTATGALEALGNASGTTPFNPNVDFTQQAMQSALGQTVGPNGAVTPNASGGPTTPPATTPTSPTTPPATPPPATPPTSSGALQRILNGTAKPEDWLSVLGGIAPTALSMYGLNQQSDNLSEIAASQQAAEQARYQDLVAREQARYEDVVGRENTRLSDLIARDSERFGTLMGREDAAIARQRGDIEFGRAQGAPYRDQLASLYAPGGAEAFLSSPAITAPVDQATNSLARALSVKGNPAGSPAAMAEIQKYAANSLAGLLGQEKDRLAGFGGLSQYAQSGAAVPGIGTNLTGSVPTPGQLHVGTPSAGSSVGTQGGLQALMGRSNAGAQMWGDLGKGMANWMSLI